MSQTKRFEFVLSPNEIKEKYPIGKEIRLEGQTWISTGNVFPPMASNYMASFPRAEFELKEK